MSCRVGETGAREPGAQDTGCVRYGKPRQASTRSRSIYDPGFPFWSSSSDISINRTAVLWVRRGRTGRFPEPHLVIGTVTRPSLPCGCPRRSTLGLGLVAYRLCGCDVLRSSDLFGRQPKGDRRLGAGVPVADLPSRRPRRLGLRSLGQLVPHSGNRVAFELFGGPLVGLKSWGWRPCWRKLPLHLRRLLAAKRPPEMPTALLQRAVYTRRRAE